jgi:hypothetical protein
MSEYKRDYYVFVGILILMLVGFFGLAIYGEHRMYKRAEACESRGGVLVKARGGYECIIAKVVQ